MIMKKNEKMKGAIVVLPLPGILVLLIFFERRNI